MDRYVYPAKIVKNNEFSHSETFFIADTPPDRLSITGNPLPARHASASGKRNTTPRDAISLPANDAEHFFLPARENFSRYGETFSGSWT
jgi:hypothetical protein